MSSLSASSPWSPWRPSSISARAGAAYLSIYFALGWISFTHPMTGLNITPWNPQSALAVGFLLWRPGAWWLVWLAATCLEVFAKPASLPWEASVLSSALLTLGFALTAAALERWLGRRPEATTRNFVAFLLVASVGAFVISVLHVLAFAGFGVPPPERMLTAIYRGWIGDAVGLLVTLPVLLALATSERRNATLRIFGTIEWWVIALVAAAGIAAVFARPAEVQFKFFYLLFLPVVWPAARFGVIGAIWSAVLVQVLVIVAVQSATYRPLTVFELQLLMAVLAATGLLLGTIVDEREEAARKLRASLRLAAAGDMAAALAHELNQPLSAMSSYAHASQLLAQRLGEHNQELARPLVDVTGKLVNEASRASDVVKRLRNFFRDRSTELQPTELAALLGEVLRPHAARARASNIRLEQFCDHAIPAVWLDHVQIAMVLRNLLANALDAASQTRAEDSESSVTVRATLHNDEITVAVIDSGPGLAPGEIAGIFENRPSEKPGGMGVGLGISRSIVEAHGGRMWAEAGPGGKFYFNLPVGSPQPNE